MKQPKTWRLRGSLRLLILGGAILAPVFPVNVASGQPPLPFVRGEAERLLRQAYDYQYRNSNNNVFRSSRHFHPTQNIFRSSRHYQQRLAASYDGYPLRTTIRYGRNNGRGRGRGLHEEVISFAHPRRSPQGPTGYGYDAYPVTYYGSAYPGFDDVGYGSSGRRNYMGAFTPMYTKACDPEVIRNELLKPRSRDEIEMVALSVPQREPTQQAVMKTITLEDGTMKTIISSVPKQPKEDVSLDEAWKRLAVGDYQRAADSFLDHSLDEKLGAQAVLGYGLALALNGNEHDGRIAVKRALEKDANLLERIRIDDSSRQLLLRLRDETDRDAPSASTDDHANTLNAASN